ncbi:MAG: SGNH/GDSL hydrolase family protein [Thermoguttaceae bacterium]|nr:SGNH/GDSL hydrolase family protein [Thermoguttaceae bacterium]
MKKSLLYCLPLLLLFLVSCSLNAQEIKLESVTDHGVTWYDAAQWPVENKGWTDVARYYARFPARAEAKVPPNVWTLSQHSTGMVVRFKTDGTSIRVKYRLLSGSVGMPHMPPTGVSGIDLYAKSDDGKWLWAGCTRPSAQDIEELLIDGMESKLREFMLYLPLYNGVEFLNIGVPENSVFEAVLPRTDPPIVYYGTSIAHGGCASRPGMAYTAILGRRLDIPVVNLGFSGSACSEIEIAELMAELNPAMYVLDPLPNMTPELVSERMIPFIQKLREKHPETPILLVEDRCLSNTWLRPGQQEFHRRNQAALKKCYDELKPNDPNLYYLGTTNLLGENLDFDGTVDSSHPNDLGMYRMTDALEAVIRPILKK